MASKIQIDIPRYQLSIENVKEIVDEAGRAVRDAVVKKARSGQDADGKPLHRPIDGGKPLDRTGALIDSIVWRQGKKGNKGTVKPSKGRKRSKGQKTKQPNNLALAMILSVPDKRPNGQRPAMKLMDTTENERDAIVRRADERIDADLTSSSTRRVVIGGR